MLVGSMGCWWGPWGGGVPLGRSWSSWGAGKVLGAPQSGGGTPGCWCGPWGVEVTPGCWCSPWVAGGVLGVAVAPQGAEGFLGVLGEPQGASGVLVGSLGCWWPGEVWGCSQGHPHPDGRSQPLRVPPAAFIRVVGSEFVQKYLGEGPRMVRDVFRLAKENAPAIIFIDEIDAIATKRFDAQTGGEGTWGPCGGVRGPLGGPWGLGGGQEPSGEFHGGVPGPLGVPWGLGWWDPGCVRPPVYGARSGGSLGGWWVLGGWGGVSLGSQFPTHHVVSPPPPQLTGRFSASSWSSSTRWTASTRTSMSRWGSQGCWGGAESHGY